MLGFGSALFEKEPMELQALCDRLTDIKKTVSSQLAKDQNQLTLSIKVADTEVAAIPFRADESPVCSGPSQWLMRKNQRVLFMSLDSSPH